MRERSSRRRIRIRCTCSLRTSNPRELKRKSISVKRNWKNSGKIRKNREILGNYLNSPVMHLASSCWQKVYRPSATIRVGPHVTNQFASSDVFFGRKRVGRSQSGSYVPHPQLHSYCWLGGSQLSPSIRRKGQSGTFWAWSIKSSRQIQSDWKGSFLSSTSVMLASTGASSHSVTAARDTRRRARSGLILFLF